MTTADIPRPVRAGDGRDAMSDALRIYFAAAVRGDASGTLLARRIEQLSELGHVLTEHMASPKTIDMGLTDDASIHAHIWIGVPDCLQRRVTARHTSS